MTKETMPSVYISVSLKPIFSNTMHEVTFVRGACYQIGRGILKNDV
jgi:hypothetical protein